MKLKIKISTFLFILLLSVSAYAQEDTYIVRFNDSMQLFSANEKQGINYTVATQEELEEYIEAGIVEDYEPNYEVFAIETYAEEAEETQPEVVSNWNFDMVNAAFAYKVGAMGNDIKVAVIDSGLHSDDMIRAQILNGYDFITDKPTDKNVSNDNADGGYHGTIVSSVIARTNHGYGTGISPKAHIMPLRVLSYNTAKETNTGSLDDIIAAIEYATYTDKCDVINLSLGIRASGIAKDELTTLGEAIQNAVNEGIIVIAAAGNDGASEYMYPASLDGVISVASVDYDGTSSEFSQHNDKVDISAPGGRMNIAIRYRVENGNGIVSVYTTNGTSISAPHVSGLAAIAKCIKPEINMAQFEEILKTTSGRNDRDDYLGYGIINCESAIKKLIEGRKIYISPVSIR
ncbi:MAG: S8 family serine peptidase, partial [Clostridia bacterium]|nr:S8 family serine peptidase [Clostridia bacterium]